MKWLHCGDGNNSYFFNRTKANWNVNKILAIEDEDGVMVSGHKNVSKVAVDFFSTTLGTHSDLEPCDFDSFDCDKITTAQALALEAPVTDDLILATLKAMKKNKAPGPD